MNLLRVMLIVRIIKIIGFFRELLRLDSRIIPHTLDLTLLKYYREGVLK